MAYSKPQKDRNYINHHYVSRNLLFYLLDQVWLRELAAEKQMTSHGPLDTPLTILTRSENISKIFPKQKMKENDL